MDVVNENPSSTSESPKETPTVVEEVRLSTKEAETAKDSPAEVAHSEARKQEEVVVVRPVVDGPKRLTGEDNTSIPTKTSTSDVTSANKSIAAAQKESVKPETKAAVPVATRTTAAGRPRATHVYHGKSVRITRSTVPKDAKDGEYSDGDFVVEKKGNSVRRTSNPQAKKTQPSARVVKSAPYLTSYTSGSTRSGARSIKVSKTQEEEDFGTMFEC